MPKKVSSILSGLFSKSRPGKLTTDASPLPDDDPIDADKASGEDPQSSSEIMTTGLDSVVVTPLNSTELTKFMPSRAEEGGDGGNALSPSVAENHLVPAAAAVNNTMAVNNIQGQNVYQFSQISGLHIGSVFNIQPPPPATTPPVSLEERTSASRLPPKSGEPIKKTINIDGMIMLS